MSSSWVRINKALAASAIAVIAMLLTPIGALAGTGSLDPTVNPIVANQYNWINVGEIDFSSSSPQRFLNGNIDLVDNVWTWEADPDKCKDTINNFSNGGGATLNINTFVNTNTTQRCKTTKTQKIQLYDNVGASKISFKQVSPNQFALISSPHKWLYNFDGGKSGTQYIRNNDNNCQDVLAKDGSGNWTLTSAVEQRNGITHIGLFDSTTTDDYLQQDYWGYPFTSGLTYASKTDDTRPQKCWISKTVPVSVDALAGAPKPTAGGAGAGGATPADQDPCASASGAYAWLLCPAVEKATTFLGDAYKNFIDPLLNIDPLTQKTTSKDASGTTIVTDNGIYAVWKAFVSLANVLFVIAFIGIIFGTVLNLDAYTVKKALPRLVIAAVAVQLSFFLCGILIDISNIFGSGMLTFIKNTIPAAPLPGDGAGGLGHTLVAGSVYILGTAAFAAALLLGPAVALMILGFVVSVFVFIATLLVRQLLIIVLIILCPIAIVAWILPNTESLFKKWKENFIKLLFIYPIMSILIGSAYIVQAVSRTPGTSGIAQIAGGIAPMIAFFMMPAVFKMSGKAMGLAGGAIGKISGAASNAGKARTEKAYDNSALLKNRASKKTAKNIRLANGEGNAFTSRNAQRKLGFGFAQTNGAKKQISALQDKQDAEKLAAASRAALDTDMPGLASSFSDSKSSEATQIAAVTRAAQSNTPEGADALAKMWDAADKNPARRAAIKKAIDKNPAVRAAVQAKAPHMLSENPDNAAAETETYSRITAENLATLTPENLTKFTTAASAAPAGSDMHTNAIAQLEKLHNSSSAKAKLSTVGSAELKDLSDLLTPGNTHVF